ncbi:MAG: ABC transporter ATP-binding protein [Kiritimatiellae bacterium]|nr:ABC transporter ATP-binding protein [Kiritimatiellia bacterium]MDW8458744.1 ABC transporter ATP-binding protein [Verrucomicrobiota bacterium]
MVAPLVVQAPAEPDSRSSALLYARSLTKRFGSFTAVRDVSFQIAEGEFFTIVGPSGSGKTTLLRMLVGMEKPTSGEILLRGMCINDLPPNRRPTCMVFQSLALFPHMTVGENVEFPLRIRNIWELDRRTRAAELLRLLHLDPHVFYNRRVTECSGGERQRVALARALAYDPEILFFDEPLSAIDARLRKILQKELKDIQRNTGKTFCYVTHSLEEAMLMSDRLAILRAGSIEQVGTPAEIYRSPRNAFVAEFMGEVNLLPVTGLGGDLGEWRVSAYRLPLRLPVDLKAGEERKLLVRPEALRFLRPHEAADNRLRVRVLNEFLMGSRKQFHVEGLGGSKLVVECPSDVSPPGVQVEVGWNLADSQLLET